MRDLLGILGFIIAGFCFFAWYGSNKDSGKTDMMALSDERASADANDFDLSSVYADKSLGQPEDVPTTKRSQRSSRSEANMAPAATASTQVSRAQMQRSVNQLAELAVASAIDRQKQVPAGTSLALLVYSAERGKQFTAENLNRVVNYLLGIKYDATKSDRSNYFKYASNSEKWFEGLAMARNGGHPASELSRIYRAYDLRQFDQNVYAFIVNPKEAKMKFDKVVKPADDAPAVVGDASDTEIRRNHASAKNRWAERASVGTEADVKFLPAKEISNNTSSEARRLVAGLSVGESITFDAPGKYHAAVREIIALEADYASWADYEAAVGRSRAKKEFRKRAEEGGFMATGALKVTRKQ